MTPEQFNKFCEENQKKVDEFTESVNQMKKDFAEIKKMVGLND